MNQINMIASCISTNLELSPELMLYEYVDQNPQLRLKEFREFCLERGVDLVMEEIFDLMRCDKDYLFTEGQDAVGRYWTVDLAEGYVPDTVGSGPYGPGSGTNPIHNVVDDPGKLAGIDDYANDTMIQADVMPECDTDLAYGDDLSDEIAANMGPGGYIAKNDLYDQT